MTDPKDTIHRIFSESINCIIESSDSLSGHIEQASAIISNQLIEGKKVFSCGNGGAASDAAYFTSNLINRLERERPSLPSICLSSDSTNITAISNDQNFNDIYSKPIRALAEAGDVLLVIATNGKSSNLIQAIQSAHEKQLFVIVLSGNDESGVEEILAEGDLEIRVNHSIPSRIKEAHLIILNCICELIDQHLFGLADESI